MSDRSYHKPQSQGLQHVQYAFRATATGSVSGTKPIMGEGDAGESYLVPQHGATGSSAHGFTGSAGGPTGMTAAYLFTTKDPFPGLVSNPQFKLDFAAFDGTYSTEGFKAVQNADGTWTFGIYTVVGGVRTDLPSGTVINGLVVFRNTKSLP